MLENLHFQPLMFAIPATLRSSRRLTALSDGLPDHPPASRSTPGR